MQKIHKDDIPSTSLGQAWYHLNSLDYSRLNSQLLRAYPLDSIYPEFIEGLSFQSIGTDNPSSAFIISLLKLFFVAIAPLA